ncbi:MAG: VOC family protein [Pyrinomonadaceae bacterium]
MEFFSRPQRWTLRQWYQRHLGFEINSETGASFSWRDENDPTRVGVTVWTLFPQDTKYFEPSQSPFMINFRVADLDALLVALREEGVTGRRAH